MLLSGQDEKALFRLNINFYTIHAAKITFMIAEMKKNEILNFFRNKKKI